MKQVVKQKINGILSKDLSTSQIVIGEYKSEYVHNFGIAMQDRYKDGLFRLVSLENGFTRHNGFSLEGSTLAELVEKASDDWTFYVFDSFKEASVWMSKNLGGAGA